MKLHFLFFLSVFLFSGCGPDQSDIQKLAAEEQFPEDVYLASDTTKRAMVIVAHDDDCSAMAGTLAMLKSRGWTIRQLCFISGTPGRDSAFRKAAPFILNATEFIAMSPEERRPGQDSSTIPYMPIPKKSIPEEFKYNDIAKLITSKIRDYNPSVIFSLDNLIGGYGHPEHLLVSQLLVDSFAAGAFQARCIYQSVYPNSMEKTILKERLAGLMEKWGFPSSYTAVTEMYKVDGMPEPDVQINITSQSEAKMNFLRAFDELNVKPFHFMCRTSRILITMCILVFLTGNFSGSSNQRVLRNKLCNILLAPA